MIPTDQDLKIQAKMLKWRAEEVNNIDISEYNPFKLCYPCC